MTTVQFSLVIPLWNEERNVEALVEMLGRCRLFSGKALAEAILVDNGCTDGTGALLDAAAAVHDWVRPIHLANNLNYGGGVLEGCRRAFGTHLVFMPGDLQYLEDDLDQVTQEYSSLLRRNPEGRVIVKGQRIARADGGAFQFVSWSYTHLANLILGVNIRDVNGLPKMFHQELLALLPQRVMSSFVLDAQLLYTARRHDWPIYEVPVNFHARRTGISSWSQRRIRVYLTSILQLLIVRAQPKVQSIGISR